MGCLSVTLSYILFSTLHLACFAIAIAVCGLYGVDLSNGSDSDVPGDSRWVYAVVVGGLSAVTCAIYSIPFLLRNGGIFKAVWDFILFVLWIAVFGVFARMYLHEDPDGDSDIRRMKNAVWVDLASALLWLIVTLASLGYWWKHRDTRTQFTGRAHV